MSVDEQMTPGVLRALNKRRSRTICVECGFPMPVYPGRYQTKCPSCDAARDNVGAAGTPKPDGKLE